MFKFLALLKLYLLTTKLSSSFRMFMLTVELTPIQSENTHERVDWPNSIFGERTLWTIEVFIFWNSVPYKCNLSGEPWITTTGQFFNNPKPYRWVKEEEKRLWVYKELFMILCAWFVNYLVQSMHQSVGKCSPNAHVHSLVADTQPLGAKPTSLWYLT